MSIRFDVNKWLLHCLPPVLRRRVIYALFSCCLHPIKAIYARYAEYSSLINSQLTSRSYTGSLAAWLNSVFYLPEGTIYIEDSIDDTNYLFCKDEVPETKYLFTESEGNARYLNYRPDEIFDGFYIHIPVRLATDANVKVIEKWINYYKIAGVNYRIITDE